MACQTNTDRKSFVFIWILENFEYCWQKTGKSLKSPTFLAEKMQRTKWSLSIKPRGYESDRWISLYLGREQDSMGSDRFAVDYEIAILASDGSILTSQIECNHAFLKDGSWGFHEFEERETIFSRQSEFLPNGVLTLRCRLWGCEMEVKKDGLCIARTHISVERRTFLWELRKSQKSYVASDKNLKLKSASNDGTIVTVKVFLKNNPSSLDILVKSLDWNESIVLSTFKSYLVDAQSNYGNYNKKEFWFSPAMQNEDCALSLSKDMLTNNRNLYTRKKGSTLYCEYAYSYGVTFEGIEDTYYGCPGYFITSNVFLKNIKTACVKKSDLDTTDLKMDINSLWQKNYFCDVKLCTGSETFPAHSIILSARSRVFRAMFWKNSKKEEQIDVADLKPDTVRHMLLYMYTDSLEELQWDMASDLYVAAEKYQILSLRNKCCSFLKTNLNLDNASKVLLLANLHQDKKLKATVQDFISKNDKSTKH